MKCHLYQIGTPQVNQSGQLLSEVSGVSLLPSTPFYHTHLQISLLRIERVYLVLIKIIV